jgi:hypothetical protein
MPNINSIIERNYTLPELAKLRGVKGDDYADFVKGVIAAVDRGELELGRIEDRGWSIQVVRRKR